MGCSPAHGLPTAPKEQPWVGCGSCNGDTHQPPSPSITRRAVPAHWYADTDLPRVFISTHKDASQAELSVNQLRGLESCPGTSFPTPSHSVKAALTLPAAAQC